MRILLQFPEGLKQKALEYAETYRKEGHEIFVSGAACYGACDLALDEARAIHAEKIIHFGHSEFKFARTERDAVQSDAPFLKEKPPVEVEYIEYHIDADLEKLKKAIEQVKEEKIALGTTVQHIHQFGKMKEIFRSSGKTIYTGKGNFAYHEGQVLGCDHIAVTQFGDAGAIVIIGDGLFHAIGADTEKPVYVVHPQSGNVRNIADEIEKLKKRRKGSIAKAIECEKFAVLLSTKPGQFRPEVADKMKKELESIGKKVIVITANELSPSSLANFNFDCYVNTACPRIADDTEVFEKPLLNPDMVMEMVEMIRAK